MKERQDDGCFLLRSEERTTIDAGQPVITTACGLYLLGPPAKK